MSSGLKFFYDAFSQPSRAVLMLLEIEKIPYQSCLVNIARGEHLSNEDFARASPVKTVPAIRDNDLNLFESAAIMKYLIQKYKLPDHWYPSDMAKRAKIEEYLNWHATGMRLGAANYMFQKFIFPKMSGSEPREKRVNEAKQILLKGMDHLESHFLKDSKFINSSEISIADLQAVCELTQFWLADVDPLADRPNLKKWMDNVQQELNPVFDNAHKMVYLARSKGVFGKGSKL